jgi:hypothetical protein
VIDYAYYDLPEIITLIYGAIDVLIPFSFFYEWIHVGLCFLCTLGSSTNKTVRHDTAEILLKVALNTITLTPMIQYAFFWIDFKMCLSKNSSSVEYKTN